MILRPPDPEFEVLTKDEAFHRVQHLKIMCRARPTDKQRSVQLLQKSGSVVAVTGDVTNDAPALNHAHVGLSMGSVQEHLYLSMKPESPKLTEYHDNLWRASPKDTADFFKTNTTPWIAYKVLAAEAIKPAEGIEFAFENGADFACVGMFDFQVIENANIVYNTLKGDLKRERKWYS